MSRHPEIGNVQLYPNRPLNKRDKNGYVLKFYCPIRGTRVRKNCGTRDRREARRILRECRERLLNGKYIESDGAITTAHESIVADTRIAVTNVINREVPDRSWRSCLEHYLAHRKSRVREKSFIDVSSRLEIAGRILEAAHVNRRPSTEIGIREFTTLESLEYLQERLLTGDECRFDSRSIMTVNSMMAAVMAFVRFCHKHDWIDRIPPLSKLDADHVMKGRPITTSEYEAMLIAIPDVVGERSSASWKQVLRVLWESAFRVGEVMDFSWDDERKIHPLWPQHKGEHPTVAIPSSQKNKKAQEIPMLPGLQTLLEETPQQDRRGWVVNPLPMDYQLRAQGEWFKPDAKDLKSLTHDFNNGAIAKACSVTETTVRKWLKEAGIERSTEFDRHHGRIDDATIVFVRKQAMRMLSHSARRTTRRLSKERVSRIIAMIGEKAGVVVQQPDNKTGRRLKYASAHDLRRGCAQRLINAGVSAETLKVLLRHQDFDTTERFYGATRAAQSAAVELHDKLALNRIISADDSSSQLSPDELQKLRALLNSLS